MEFRIEFILFSILVFYAIIPAYADENNVDNNQIILGTDKPEYKIGDSLIISGIIEEKKMPVVALKLFDPNGKIISANQVEVNDDNTFSKIISLETPFYEKTGMYTVNLNYGKQKAETFFDMVNKVEETSNESNVIEPTETPLPEITMNTDKAIYQDKDTIIITGTVSSIQDPSVLVGIYDPFDTPAGFYFVDVNHNMEFSVSFLVKGGVNFMTEGTYSVVAHYGDVKDTITFDYVNAKESIEPVIAFDENDESKVEDEVNDEQIFSDSPTQNNEQDDEIQPTIIIDTKLNDDNIVQDNDVDNEIIETEAPKITDNLSVEDIELGKLLNSNNLNCDKSEFADTISYYDGKGPALIRLCKYNDAISYYDKALHENPNNVEILNNKGSALGKMGYYDEAIVYYDSALIIDSEFVPALNNKANALASVGYYEEAISTYNKALLIAPDNAIAINNLAKTKDKLTSFNQDIKEENTIVLENTPNPIDTITKSPNILEQISTTLSSIGNAIFGFLS